VQQDSRGTDLDIFLRAELEAVLPAPKPRSKTWLSTCFPLDSEDPAAAVCGPGYHVRPAARTRRSSGAVLVCSSAAPAAAWGSIACPGGACRAARLRTWVSVGEYQAVHGMPGKCVAGRRARARAGAVQVHSYVSHVRFMEACAAIPADALLLEVGPHALLRSPLRQNRATLPCAPPSLADERAVLLTASVVCLAPCHRQHAGRRMLAVQPA